MAATAQVKARDPLAALRTKNRLGTGRGPGASGRASRRPSPPPVAAPESPAISLGAGRISRDQIVYLTSQLAVMLQTGINLSQALAGILRQEKHPGLQRVLGQLVAALERGEAFSEALSHFPRLFDQSYVAMVKAAEASGSMGPVMERLAINLRKSQESRARVRAALAYPIVMLVLAVGVCVFLLTYVIPRFAPLFQARGVSLPTPTRIVLSISGALVGWWYLWLAGAAAFLLAYVTLRKTPGGRRWLDHVKLKLPVVGPVLRKAAVSQSIRTLGTLLTGGVGMLEALRLTAEASGNAEFTSFWHLVVEEVTRGKALSEVLATTPLIPPTVVQMVAAGEEGGKLPDVLTKLADHLEADVDIAVKAATALMEPILIAGMGAIVGTIGLAVLLPIFTLSRPM